MTGDLSHPVNPGNTPSYTLGLFTNMYPAFEGDYRGIFIRQMVTDLEERGVKIFIAAKPTPSLLGYISFAARSVRLARRKDLDLLQAEYIPHSSLIPALLGRRTVPIILKFHGDDARIFPFKNRVNMALTRAMIRRAAHIVTASEEIRKTLIDIGAPSDRVTAIHSGVDTAFFTGGDRQEARARLGLPPKKTIFLFVGRLHPWKGIPELVEAARACPEHLFLFIGPGSPPDHPDNCIFFGTVPHREVRAWMNAADCLVLPTHTEAVPTSVMEAFACGIPAITTNIGGCPEIVTDQKNGLMVPVGDTGALVAAVEWMGSHEEERMQMGHDARATVVQRYDHRIMTARLIGIHTTVLENTRPASLTK
ncbi:glycosyltransferase family 4 protein [Methanoregula sp.]|uniref:glycosyltransferase family 4 protein n=1 Tax=Methanoregula sp. TaxID=2052170 RepID=UPI003BAF24DD